MGLTGALEAHLASGVTTICRAWAIVRKDGVIFGFTDHDCELTFEGVTFKADTGMSAMALAQSTGLSVDNTEAIGALSDASVREDDIEAGRFDDAQVKAWLVNWQAPEERWLQFSGSIGEIRRAGGAFQAELRGLSEVLNQPQGRVYQKPCTAVLGDGNCKFDLSGAGFSVEIAIEAQEEGRVFTWDTLDSYTSGWFARGRLDVLDGPGKGLWAMIKSDRLETLRRVELWAPIRAELAAGQRVRLTTGCDKRFETCRLKFNNLLNFQGFPDVPGEDWLTAVPRRSGPNSGGSRR